MTTVDEATREGSAPAAPQDPETTAVTRACARASVPPASLLPSREVTQRVRVAREHLGKLAAYLDRPGSLVHAQPPTFARARELHHHHAGRHAVPVLKGLRLAWGYFHLLIIKPPLNFAEWVTETPLRLLGATVLALIVWHWS